jgi:hypothetical protein
LFKPKDKLELTLFINYADILTRDYNLLTCDETKKVPKLRSMFYYNNQRIDNLLKIDLEFVNTGSKTIIGDGNQKNIMGNCISIPINDRYNIIEAKEIKSDVYNKVTINKNIICLYLKQLRSDEKVSYSFYIIVPSKNISDTVIFNLKDRPLIDGEIEFKDERYEKKITIVPSYIFIPANVITIITTFVFYAFFMMLFINLISNYIETLLWERKNKNIFNLYIDSKYYNDPILAAKYKNNPLDLDENSWDGFTGEKLNAKSSLIGYLNNWKKFITIFTFYLLIVISLIITSIVYKSIISEYLKTLK